MTWDRDSARLQEPPSGRQLGDQCPTSLISPCLSSYWSHPTRSQSSGSPLGQPLSPASWGTELGGEAGRMGLERAEWTPLCSQSTFGRVLQGLLRPKSNGLMIAQGKERLSGLSRDQPHVPEQTQQTEQQKRMSQDLPEASQARGRKALFAAMTSGIPRGEGGAAQWERPAGQRTLASSISKTMDALSWASSTFSLGLLAFSVSSSRAPPWCKESY